MGNKSRKKRTESRWRKKKRCQAAHDVKEALNKKPSTNSRQAALNLRIHQLGMGRDVEGIQISALRCLAVINLDNRDDRRKSFMQRANGVDWKYPINIVRVSAVGPDHPNLTEGNELYLPPRAPVALESSLKQRKIMACVLSHIHALRKLERLNIWPAMVCEDDLILTNDGAQSTVPLPALAAAISIAHDPAVTNESQTVFLGDDNTEALVATKENGYKSSSAGYLVHTRIKCRELCKRLNSELQRGLRAPMDGLLLHPRLFADTQTEVLLTKKTIFKCDTNSWSSMETL